MDLVEWGIDGCGRKKCDAKIRVQGDDFLNQERVRALQRSHFFACSASDDFPRIRVEALSEEALSIEALRENLWWFCDTFSGEFGGFNSCELFRTPMLSRWPSLWLVVSVRTGADG